MAKRKTRLLIEVTVETEEEIMDSMADPDRFTQPLQPLLEETLITAWRVEWPTGVKKGDPAVIAGMAQITDVAVRWPGDVYFQMADELAGKGWVVDALLAMDGRRKGKSVQLL